jgi:N-acetylglucosaminyldiphosphoundecaprenol N-acetyl-beta-D-mannosaminyltransferase
VPGSNLFEALHASTEPLGVYFFGGPEGVAEAACQSLAHSQSLHCAGFTSPGFGTVEKLSQQAILEPINDSGADFLVLALGAKKGQAWMLRNLSAIKIPVVAHLGAVINFTAGSVRRAPAWMQRAGLEWLWRIREEPQLWRRYLWDGITLIKVALTRIIPYAIWLRLYRRGVRERFAVEITHNPDRKADGVSLCLMGACCYDQRPGFVMATQAAVVGTGDIYVDMGRVTFLDPAGLGLILQLEGIALRRSSVLRITDLAPQLHPVLRWNAMTHLLA